MKKSKRSVRWLWCWSYIIVMLIPMITVVINYSINTKALKDEFIRTNELSLNHVKENIDNLLAAEKEFYSYAFLDENFESLRYSSEKDSRFYYVVSLLCKNLASYRNGIENMTCMLFLEKEDYLITNFVTCSTETYHKAKQYSLNNMPEYEVWKEVLSEEYKDTYFIGQGFSNWADEKSFIYANTVGYAQKGKQNFFVSIPLSSFEDILEFLSPDTWLVVEVNEQKVAFYNGILTDIPEELEAGLGYISLRVDSVTPGISYQLLISETNVQAEFADMHRSFLLSLVITLIFGAIGIAVLLNVNYKPLLSLLQEIDEKEDDSGEGNEFQKLKDNYVQLRKEKLDSQMLVEQQKKELQNVWLLMLMKGRTVKHQEKEDEEYLGLTLTNRVALIGFMIPLEEGDIQYEELKFFIVDNIFSELMEKEKFYHVEDGGFIFYLFDLKPDEEEEWRREALKKVEFLREMVSEKFKIPIIGVVSDIGEGVQVIKNLYQDVVEGFEYGSVAGGHGVIDVRELPNYNELHLLKDYMNMEFREAFVTKDVNRAYTVTEKLFAGRSGLSMTIAKIRVYEAFILVMDIFKEYVNDAVKQEKAIGYLEMLIGERTVEGIRAHFNELLQFLIDEISNQQLLENKGIIIKMMKYIESHYTDCNLNLSSMAEDLQKNSRYLSRVFKEEKKISILDYINSYRIMKAKELMQTREYTMEEIAKQVGYGNIRTFRRAFVKITGELPSMYIDSSPGAQ